MRRAARAARFSEAPAKDFVRPKVAHASALAIVKGGEKAIKRKLIEVVNGILERGEELSEFQKAECAKFGVATSVKFTAAERKKKKGKKKEDKEKREDKVISRRNTLESDSSMRFQGKGNEFAQLHRELKTAEGKGEDTGAIYEELAGFLSREF